MGQLRKKIIAALRSKLGDVADALDEIEQTGRVMGVVISDKFEKLDHQKRQKLIWETLKKTLTDSELQNVGPIATLTPVEATVKAE